MNNYAVGAEFMLFVDYAGTDAEHEVNNRHARYDRVVGFRRAIQRAIDASAAFRDMYVRGRRSNPYSAFSACASPCLSHASHHPLRDLLRALRPPRAR